MTFLPGLASVLLVLALLAGERAEGQSEVASLASPDPDAALPVVTSSSSAAPSAGAALSLEAASEEARSPGSLLFSAFGSESADAVLPPQSPGKKLSQGILDSVRPGAFLFTAAQAGIAQAGNKYPAFHQGAAGYARYFWHDFADQASQKILVESVLPVVFHDDNRYYRLGRGNFFHRTGYALSRLVVTRNDDARNTINLPEIIGTGAAAGISNTYYPHRYYNWTRTGQRWAFNAAFDGGLMLVKEFWPEFSHAVLRMHN